MLFENIYGESFTGSFVVEAFMFDLAVNIL